ncbi:MAG: hypothetical protein J6P12_02860 [Methanobrevibacter sp.]|nr:hypothetical protein [Methanobrevibacter sp.]
MKKRILIITLLLVILSISVVSAAENTTELADINETLENTQKQDFIENTDEIPLKDGEKQDLNIEMLCPDNIVKPNPGDFESSISFRNIPNDYENEVTIYIDDVQSYNGHPYLADEIRLSELDYGKHIIKATFAETEKYNPLTITHEVNIVEGYIYIPSEVKNQESIELILKDSATGYFTVNVDGKLFKKVKVNTQSYDLSYTFVSLATLSKGTHTVEAIYSGDANNKKLTKKATINVVSEISIYIEVPDKSSYYNGIAMNAYGSEMNRVEIYISSDATKMPIATVDGVAYDVTGNDEYYYVNTSTLKPGIHLINITYPGDDKYPQKSVTKTFETICHIAIYTPNELDYRYNNTEIYLKMPDDAQGDLNVYVDGKAYETCPVENGTAHIFLKNVNIGYHHLQADYTGNDYNVSNISKNITILPNLIYPKSKYYKERATFYVEVNPDANITIHVSFDASSFDLTLVDGKGNFSITDLVLYDEWGDYSDIELKYSGDLNTYDSPSVYLRVKRYQLNNAQDITMYYGDSKTYTVTLLDDLGEKVNKNYAVQVKIGSKYYSAPVKNGIAKLKISEIPGTYKVVASFDNAKVTTKLIVKQVLNLKTVTVKKSAKKLTLQATLKNKNPIKNKQVTFKFNGKTYKAKTNSKGVAKVTIKSTVLKKLKAGKKITYQATYLKDTVKKTVKVKK